jgi:tetratricopeptide (TPR) repeat protein
MNCLENVIAFQIFPVRNMLKGIDSLKFFLILTLLTICGGYLSAQVTLSEQEWVLPTYMVEPADKNPMFFRGESYQGASKYIYPYGLNDVISDKRIEKAWKSLLLENEYIKVCITPEIGGKLYYAADKTNDYNFIYKNNVVKPSNIGMTGAWVSGGIEWCVFHHHRASTFLPVDYEMVENKDGSKTIWVGETEPRHRMRWTIGITVFPGKSYFEAEVKMHNPTPYTHTLLYWANLAAHTNKDYQTIFPPSAQIATYHAKNSFTRWPISTEVYTGVDFTKGVDISWWKNVVNANSFFVHELKEDFMGGYDHGKQTGIVHVADHNIVKGAKLWEWGSGARGQATEARLTENDGPYVELMVGAFSDNQPDYSWIRPYEVKTFKHYWYPVKDIQGFKYANLNGAVNLEPRNNNTVFLGYYSTQRVGKAKIVLKNSNKVIFERTMEISPDKAFTHSIKVDKNTNVVDLSTEMINMETGEVLVSYQPVEQQPLDKLPEEVKSPPAPEEIATIEELYLTGSRIDQFYNPRFNSMDYYDEALKRDPDDIRTNTAVGNIFLKNGDFINARYHLGKAIKRLTKDYTRPSTGEALYLQGVTLKALGLYDEAVDTLYRATWDYAYHSAAYLELARISTQRGDFKTALAQINESLYTNARNNSAIGLKASIQRKMGDLEGAIATLTSVLESDPLDFRAGNENYLIAKASGDVHRAEKELSMLIKKMRGFDQNYLELAVAYLNDGLLEESEDILRRFNGKNPLFSYYMGYIHDKIGNKGQAGQLFKSGSGQSVDYIFPFRLETIEVLKTALKYNPADGKAYYYLGNVLFDKQPGKAIESWESAVKYDPELAIAHRNLGWGYYRHAGDGLKAIAAYERAITLNNSEPAYYNELDALYEMSNAPIEKRLKLFEASNKAVKKRDDSFLRQIVVLNLAGETGKAVEYLTDRNFSYVEGSSRVREVIIDTHLMMGKKYFAEKKYQEALRHFLFAEVPEEEGGSTRSGNRDVQVNYYIGLSYEALGNKAKARNYFNLSANQRLGRSNYMGYYQGLSYLKLGKTAQATEIFKALISDGNLQIEENASTTNDFFAKFGEREAENTRISQAYLLRAMGYKGLGENGLALEDLRKSVDLSVSNLWAKSELKNWGF